MRFYLHVLTYEKLQINKDFSFYKVYFAVFFNTNSCTYGEFLKGGHT